MDEQTRQKLHEKGYTDEEIDKNLEMLSKVGKIATGVAVTSVAVAGASIVAAFKKDAKPISKTFDACKNFFFK